MHYLSGHRNHGSAGQVTSLYLVLLFFLLFSSSFFFLLCDGYYSTYSITHDCILPAVVYTAIVSPPPLGPRTRESGVFGAERPKV